MTYLFFDFLIKCITIQHVSFDKIKIQIKYQLNKNDQQYLKFI